MRLSSSPCPLLSIPRRPVRLSPSHKHGPGLDQVGFNPLPSLIPRLHCLLINIIFCSLVPRHRWPPWGFVLVRPFCLVILKAPRTVGYLLTSPALSIHLPLYPTWRLNKIGWRSLPHVPWAPTTALPARSRRRLSLPMWTLRPSPSSLRPLSSSPSSRMFTSISPRTGLGERADTPPASSVTRTRTEGTSSSTPTASSASSSRRASTTSPPSPAP